MKSALAGLLLLLVAETGMARPAAQDADAEADPVWWAPMRVFTTSSSSMLPTLPAGTRLVAYRKRPDSLRRGQVIVFRVGPQFWVKRLAGLPGDRIAMREGVVALNGTPVMQTPVGSGSAKARRTVRRLVEKFPGEVGTHQILDAGPSPGDDVEEVRVARGTVYVLGDNRDDSLDSRFVEDASVGGGPVRIADIYGVVDPTKIR